MNARVGAAPGQIRATGTCTDGGGYTFYQMRVEVGNYQFQPDPNNPGQFITVFVPVQWTA